MQNITIAQNDKGYLISIPITNSAGISKDLTNYDVDLKAWLPGSPETLIIDGACTKVNPNSSGVVTYTLLAEDTAVGARYIAKCEMTMTDVIESTQEFTIVIPSQTLYCTLSEVKAELEITGEERDDYLYAMVEQVTGLIDTYCQRSFTPVIEIRYFDGADDILFIDDLISIDHTEAGEGEVQQGVWLDDGDRGYDAELDAIDYDLAPYNKIPKTRLELAPGGSVYDLADGVKKGVKIAGKWGYSNTVPSDIRRAAIMWVTIFETQRKAGYSNVVGNTETGQILIDKDPPAQVKKILEKFRRVRYL